MTTRVFLVFCLVFVFWMSGCGSQPAANETAVKNSPAGSPAVTPDTGQPPAGIAVPTSNSTMDPNAPPAGDVAMANKRGVVEGPPGPQMQAPLKVFPDSSTLTTTMAKNGAFVETRVFSADPAVAKVERTTFGKDRTVKVFLKNGRVVIVPADKIESISRVTVDTIKALAGVKPPPAPPSDSRSDDTKKKP